MEAEQFYQTSGHNVCPITFLTKEAYTQRTSLQSEEKAYFTQQQFSGNSGEICYIGHPELQKVYIGMGQEENAEVLAIAQAVNRLLPLQYSIEPTISPNALLIWSLAQYKFSRYKEVKITPRILTISNTELYEDILNEANAVFLIRDLINTPTNDMGPAELADALSFVALTHDATFEQWVGDELMTENFPAIHTVGHAAKTPPRLLSLTWGDNTHPKVTLIGKGVCFDSGGLDLKSSSNMRLMKKDMGGAAQVIGLAQWIMAKKIPIYLTVLIPAVENAIGAGAYRPGDVLIMRNSMTVEIENTDAEGRLVVADAISKACEENPDLIIDITTLTGAARIAVGTEISALFTNNDNLADELMRSGKIKQDILWRMPLHPGYESMLDSSIADLSNASSSSYAGAITAALFLQRFINTAVDWVHLDIMAWNVSNKPGKPEGGEAMGMRAIAHYLQKRYAR